MIDLAITVASAASHTDNPELFGMQSMSSGGASALWRVWGDIKVEASIPVPRLLCLSCHDDRQALHDVREGGSLARLLHPTGPHQGVTVMQRMEENDENGENDENDISVFATC